jgi:hypothetical protein
MPAGKYSFTVEQGTTVDLTLQYKDANNNPISLSGYSAQMQLRPAFADFTDVKYLTLSSSLDPDGSGLVLTPESGSIRIYISATKTDLFDFDEALYDLELYTGSFVARLMEGKIKISRSVTR